MSQYNKCAINFCNIENIHTIRRSFQAVTDLVMPGGTCDAESNYLTKLEESGWLKHIRLILQAAITTSQKLYFEKTSVLVHCSDGWDRTAQICATVQLMLDPYYRTIEGFAVVIEKEWCSFGHKFNVG